MKTLPLFSLALFLVACAQSHAPTPATSQANVPNFQEFAALSENQLPAAEPSCDMTCTKRRLEFRYVAYVGKQIYCYWDLKKAETRVDFDGLAKSLENSITSATSLSDYFLLLRKWASAFHDGHVNAMYTKVTTPQMEIYTAPFRVRVLAPATDHEKVIVSKTNDAAIANVGDEVLAVNGVPVHEAISAAAEVSASGSTERMRRYGAASRLVDAIGAANAARSFTITLKPFAGGEVKTVPAYRTVDISVAASPALPEAAPDTGADNFKAQILGDNIGFFRLDAFEGSQDEALISGVMDRLAGTRGLILDLRQNGGGDLSGDKIIERLIQQRVVRYHRSERYSDYILSQEPEIFGLPLDPTGLFAAWHPLWVQPLANKFYGKPVVALTSTYCFSACDTFTAALKGNQLATIVGEATGGGTGTPLPFDLPFSPLKFRYSVTRGQAPDGSLIEGQGTQPDVLIEPTVNDIGAHKDSQLVKALEVLEGKIQQTNPSIAVNLFSLPAIQEPSLDISPTSAANDYLLKISASDERAPGGQ